MAQTVTQEQVELAVLPAPLESVKALALQPPLNVERGGHSNSYSPSVEASAVFEVIEPVITSPVSDASRFTIVALLVVANLIQVSQTNCYERRFADASSLFPIF